jgi:hypothetical protein
MSDNDVVSTRVVAVLLADGWHHTVPGSFSVGQLGFDDSPDSGMPGFCFEEAEVGSPYRPKVLAGPLGSIIAIRQTTRSLRRHPDGAPAARNGQHADHSAWLPVSASA